MVDNKLTQLPPTTVPPPLTIKKLPVALIFHGLLVAKLHAYGLDFDT